MSFRGLVLAMTLALCGAVLASVAVLATQALIAYLIVGVGVIAWLAHTPKATARAAELRGSHASAGTWPPRQLRPRDLA